MFIKFIADDGELVVETKSYKVYQEETNSPARSIVVGYMIEDSGGKPIRVEFRVSKDIEGDYRVAFVMNDKGETIDRICAPNQFH